MNEFQLEIKAKQCIEMLERILRVIRHRGGRILQMNVIQNTRQVEMQLNIVSEKAPYLIENQIRKLINVESVIRASAK